MSFYFELFVNSVPLLMKGMMMTVKILLASISLSLSLGLVFGIICCEELKMPFISRFVQVFTFVLRSVPFYVQLLIVYFVFPDLVGINLDLFPASVLSLGLCSSGYICQIVRCGINSIPTIQWEAAHVLGYGRIRTLFDIILRQMFYNVLPAFNNEMESVLKSTAILASIGMLELTRIGMNIVSREAQDPLAIYLIIALFYVGMSLVLNFVAKYLEKKMLLKVRD